MKLTTIFLSAFVTLFALPAQAVTAPVDFNGTATGPTQYYVDMGYVPAGQYGSINTTPFFGLQDYVANGSLAGKTAITFTYNVVPSAVTGITGPVDFWYTPTAADPTKYSVLTTKDFDKNVFTLVISNLLDSTLSFSAGLALSPMFQGTVNTAYNAVSNVPLPAALPLFGLGLAGLAGYRAKKSKKEAATA
ncbi:MAG: VPLPA-CTERM sorting domain-containing protein [Bdellovibrionales bacterium]|jgi:hypothetical protein